MSSYNYNEAGILLLIFIFSTSVFSSSCNLIVDQELNLKESLGNISFIDIATNFIWLSVEMGDRRASFNFDDLFELTNFTSSYYFRMNGKAYNHTDSKQTFLYDLAWGGNVLPSSSDFMVTSYTTVRQPIFERTLDTVGDSITWWYQGRFFRCLMRDKGLDYDFVGSHTDIFGFGHDGEGGNTSKQLLGRINSIPAADAYLLLIGTNDRISPLESVDNIVEIARELRAKKSSTKVYISTLLPRVDEYNKRNQEINILLRDYGFMCDSCVLIDIGEAFYALPNWQNYLSDGLHPNFEGYTKITEITVKYLKSG